jgi:hypothetical protein
MGDAAPPKRAGRKATKKTAGRVEATATDPIAQLRQLNELREQGILTDEEFAAEKAKLLG